MSNNYIYMYYRLIIVGSTKGAMNLVDLRKTDTLLNTYKGFTGSVTGIACSNPYIASVSLDRHLRIHDMYTKAILKKVISAFSLCAKVQQNV